MPEAKLTTHNSQLHPYDQDLAVTRDVELDLSYPPTILCSFESLSYCDPPSR